MKFCSSESLLRRAGLELGAKSRILSDVREETVQVVHDFLEDRHTPTLVAGVDQHVPATNLVQVRHNFQTSLQLRRWERTIKHSNGRASGCGEV